MAHTVPYRASRVQYTGFSALGAYGAHAPLWRHPTTATTNGGWERPNARRRSARKSVSSTANSAI